MDEQEAPTGTRSAHSAPASATAHLFTAQQAALRELMAGMDADGRWVLLVGPEGSGKSTVVRALLDELRLASATVAAFEARKTPGVDHLVAGLSDKLGLPRKRGLLGHSRSVSDITTGLRTPLVVVVDDADALASESVRWLARLAASASRTETACYVVLAGTSKLGDAAGSAWAKRAPGRASVRCRLGPMTPVEVRRYVHACTGDATAKFSEAAVEQVEMYAKGRPGLIRELCVRAVKLPSARLTNEVSVDAIVDTAKRLGLSDAPGSSADRDSHIERGSTRHVARRMARVVGMTTLLALSVFAGIRVGLAVFAPSSGSRAAPVPVVDRSRSDIAGSQNGEARRALEAPTGRGRGGAVSTPSSRQGREQRLAEGTQPTIAREPSPPSPQKVAALMARAREGEVGALKQLVSDGVSPNVRDVGGFTPLMAAVVNDQISAARVLLDHGADVNARAHGGLTPLMLAVINDRPGAVKLLLERNAEVNAQSGAGWTALSFAAWKGDAALVRELLSHGAKPTVTDKQGWRPVEYGTPKFTPTEADPGLDAGRGASESALSNQAGRR